MRHGLQHARPRQKAPASVRCRTGNLFASNMFCAGFGKGQYMDNDFEKRRQAAAAAIEEARMLRAMAAEMRETLARSREDVHDTRYILRDQWARTRSARENSDQMCLRLDFS